MTLETDRLDLRNYQLEDLENLYEYFSLEEVSRYEDFYPMTMEQVREQTSEWMHMDNRLVVALKASKKVIGSVGYWVLDDGNYSIDFDFNPAYSKHGYATEAASELVDYLFKVLKIPKIYGDCDVRNNSSARLLERLGFKKIKQIDNTSYKNDKNGNPVLISIFVYSKENKLG